MNDDSSFCRGRRAPAHPPDPRDVSVEIARLELHSGRVISIHHEVKYWRPDGKPSVQIDVRSTDLRGNRGGCCIPSRSVSVLREALSKLTEHGDLIPAPPPPDEPEAA